MSSTQLQFDASKCGNNTHIHTKISIKVTNEPRNCGFNCFEASQVFVIKMIYWCSQSAFIWWSFDVAGMQLKRNIYIFTTRRTSWWGICAAWVLLNVYPIPYIELCKVKAPGFTSHSARLYITAVGTSASIWHFYLSVLHIMRTNLP